MSFKKICSIPCATEFRQLQVLLSPEKMVIIMLSEAEKTEQGIINNPLGAVQLDADSIFELNNHLLKCLTQVVSTTAQTQLLNNLCYPATASDLKYWKETSPKRNENGVQRGHLSHFLQNLIETLSDEEVINFIGTLHRHLPNDNVYRSILGKKLNMSYDIICEKYLMKKNRKENSVKKEYFWGKAVEQENVVHINKSFPSGNKG